MEQTALGGVKVLEFCSKIGGAYCTKLMADMGAEVIKIEPPARGDDARRRGPFQGDNPHPEKSGHFLFLNSNKLGTTLNPSKPAGSDIFKSLIKETDILVEDTPPVMPGGNKGGGMISESLLWWRYWLLTTRKEYPEKGSCWKSPARKL